jgi:hypothetical protein
MNDPQGFLERAADGSHSVEHTRQRAVALVIRTVTIILRLIHLGAAPLSPMSIDCGPVRY